MRIGLLRHFPVAEGLPTGWHTGTGLQAWRRRYDAAAPLLGAFDLGGIAWQHCIASDLPRALLTARAVYAGEVEPTPLLREAEFAEFATGGLRLPTFAWRWLLRLSWFLGSRSQRACRDDFRRRVLAVADRLSAADRDTLVVSHAGMMAFLSAELRRRGFLGPRLRIAEHARVYVYVPPADSRSSGATTKPAGSAVHSVKLCS
jgi:broad specificity phosphatase PhoE